MFGCFVSCRFNQGPIWLLSFRETGGNAGPCRVWLRPRFSPGASLPLRGLEKTCPRLAGSTWVADVIRPPDHHEVKDRSIPESRCPFGVRSVPCESFPSWARNTRCDWSWFRFGIGVGHVSARSIEELHRWGEGRDGTVVTPKSLPALGTANVPDFTGLDRGLRGLSQCTCPRLVP